MTLIVTLDIESSDNSSRVSRYQPSRPSNDKLSYSPGSVRVLIKYCRDKSHLTPQ